MMEENYEHENDLSVQEMATENKENSSFNKIYEMNFQLNERKLQLDKSVAEEFNSVEKEFAHIKTNQFQNRLDPPLSDQNSKETHPQKRKIVRGDLQLSSDMEKENRLVIKGVSETSSKLKKIGTLVVGGPKHEKGNSVLIDIKNTEPFSKLSGLNSEFYDEKTDVKNLDYGKVQVLENKEENGTSTKLKNCKTSKKCNLGSPKSKTENGHLADVKYNESFKKLDIINPEYCQEKNDVKPLKLGGIKILGTKQENEASDTKLKRSKMGKGHVDSSMITNENGTLDGTKNKILNTDEKAKLGYSKTEHFFAIPKIGKENGLTDVNHNKPENFSSVNLELKELRENELTEMKICAIKQESGTSDTKLKDSKVDLERVVDDPNHEKGCGVFVFKKKTEPFEKSCCINVELHEEKSETSIKLESSKTDEEAAVENSRAEEENIFDDISLNDSLDFKLFCGNPSYEEMNEVELDEIKCRIKQKIESCNEKLGNSIASEECMIDDSKHINANVALADTRNTEHFEKFPIINPGFSEEKNYIENLKEQVIDLKVKHDIETANTKLKYFETSRKPTLDSSEKIKSCPLTNVKNTESFKEPPCVNLEFNTVERDDTNHPNLDIEKNLNTKTESVGCIKLEISNTTELSFQNSKHIRTNVIGTSNENEESTKVNYSHCSEYAVEHTELKQKNGILANAKKSEPLKKSRSDIPEFSEANKSDRVHTDQDKINLGIKKNSETFKKLENSDSARVAETQNCVKENDDRDKINPGFCPDDIEHSGNKANNLKRKKCETNQAHDTESLTSKKERKILAETKNIESLEKASCSNPKFYEEEKSDIEHPEWDKVKNLNTNEERYRQVRACWGSKKVPNPNRNLTCQSFRKRRVFKNDSHEVKAHKRQASASSFPDDRKSKRSRTRSCTFHIDNKISSTMAEKWAETERLQRNMANRKEALARNFQNKETYLRNTYYNRYEGNYHLSRLDYELRKSYKDYHDQRRQIDHSFHVENERCLEEYESKIRSLRKVREEIYQFYNFYKGLDDNDDPTYMTESEFQELNEIENIYAQFDKLYGN